MKSVTFCSSNKFAKEALEFAAKLEKLGVTVLVPHFYTHYYGGLESIKDHTRPYLSMGLTLDHFQKIRKADAIFLFNPGGYSGVSVSMELGYATALGKRVYALTDEDDEICRKILVDGFASTPEELAKKLA